ncbi:hypothetical protein M2192_001222 [Bradyrhizobium elkanii USDA 61]|nr:hypothetical protein [Bradyrhizobium elkanii]MCS3479580.1 hypothetical protein [Bradyrhizobium elkanii]MCS3576968.1 hypothetical protein [Bradyrhizobium elkanii]MCS3719845.1 hypothetical protein [Bradyrhizobium elkanii]MCS4004262.1 hypothetical protein [Bradyrhizobium elkanii USDA 61]
MTTTIMESMPALFVPIYILVATAAILKTTNYDAW